MSSSPSKRVVAPMDQWSIREQLYLASAVLRNGEQNWAAVSRMIKPFGEKNRSAEWFSQKNCARQYSALLDKVEKPKRKRGGTETPGESIVRMLTDERIKDLKKLIDNGREKYATMVKEINDIENGDADDIASDASDDISDSDFESDTSESSTVNKADTKEGMSTSFDEDKSSNQFTKKVSEEHNPENRGSLSAVSLTDMDSSIFEITATPSSSTPRKSNSASPSVSPQLKNLVHTAIAGASEDDRPKTMSPTASAPTLSMLLEMPPRDRGQPLPELPSLMGTPNKSPVREKEIQLEPNVLTVTEDISSDIAALKDSKDLVQEEIKAESTFNTGNEKKILGKWQPQKDLGEQDEPSPDFSPIKRRGGRSPDFIADIEGSTSDTKSVEEKKSIESASGVNLLEEESVSTTEATTAIVEDSVKLIPKADDLTPKTLDDAKATSKNVNDCSLPVEAEVYVKGDLTEVNVIEGVCSKSELTKEPFTAEAIVPASKSEIAHMVSDSVQNVEHKKAVGDSDIAIEANKNEKADLPTPTKISHVTDEPIIKEPVVPSSASKDDEGNQIFNENLTDPCRTKTSNEKEDKDKKEDSDNCTKMKTSEIIAENVLDGKNKEDETKNVKESDKSSETMESESSSGNGKSETGILDIKANTGEEEQEHAPKSQYIGRGRKGLLVTIVENDRGEKVELKSPDGSPIKVTRNLSKETGLKIEDLPYSKKSCSVTKEKGEPARYPAKRRGNTRGATNSEVQTPKETSKTPSVPLQTSSRQTGSSKKTKSPSSDVKTPNLRSRGGTSASTTSTKEDVDKQLTSDSKPVISEAEDERKSEIKQTDSKKESSTAAIKPYDENVADSVKEKDSKGSSDFYDEFSDALSDIESKKESDSEDDESDSSPHVSSKKGTKSRKERLESADMADDDSSNSANDATTKKRVTRRSVKVLPRKSESKSKNSDEKTPFRHSDRSSLQPKDSKSEVKTGRSSKALARVKHLTEEASLIYGDLDTQTGDSCATRMTRARAKTNTSTTAVSSPSKNVTPLSEPETSSDPESKTRSTRSRTAAAVATSSSVIDQLLPEPILDSNPSSPCSSTTNSTIIDEDKDQRAFRKSVMLVWNRIAAHKFSSLFLKPISDDKAPGYLEKVQRPMDLATIKRNVETGITRNLKTFERDVYLMFMNAMMFNPTDHEVSDMSRQMERDVRVILDEHQKMLKLSLESGEALTPTSERILRRESRVLFPPVDSSLTTSRMSDSEAEIETIEEEKSKFMNMASSSSNSRKHLAGSNDGDTTEPKKRKTRTSTAHTNSGRKIKPQVSPDIVSTSYDM